MFILRRHYRHIFIVFFPFHKINSSRHNNIMAFEIRYYNANFKQRRYPIRHWIPMFFGTPCTLYLYHTSGRLQDYYQRGCRWKLIKWIISFMTLGLLNVLVRFKKSLIRLPIKSDFWLTWLIARDESEFLFQTCQFACSIAHEKAEFWSKTCYLAFVIATQKADILKLLILFKTSLSYSTWWSLL